jgi:DNA-binding NtrC family response regulator
VGSSQVQETNVRIVAATNVTIMIEKGSFKKTVRLATVGYSLYRLYEIERRDPFTV